MGQSCNLVLGFWGRLSKGLGLPFWSSAFCALALPPCGWANVLAGRAGRVDTGWLVDARPTAVLTERGRFVVLLCGWLLRRVRGGVGMGRGGYALVGPGPACALLRIARGGERDCFSRGSFCLLRPSGVCVCRQSSDGYTRKRDWACISFVREALLRRTRCFPDPHL